MSRTINLQLPEGDVRARCHESGVSLIAIETLQSGETHLVCKTADGADEMRLRLSDHVIHGTVRRFAFMARERFLETTALGQHTTMESKVTLDLSRREELASCSAANDQPAAIFRAAITAKRHRNRAHPRFDIYRADHVRLTSTLFGGGDWRWRLTDDSGNIIADCGGYRNEAQCLAAVKALRIEAGLAPIFHGAPPEVSEQSF